jgi:uncharacterized iron-regulated protein
MKLWVIVTGLFLFLFSTTPAIAAVVAAQPISQSSPEILKKLLQAQIVYLGETHDRSSDHEAQLDILKQIRTRQPKLAIALEMFQKPYQASLDRYLRGKLTEAELLAQTEYPKRWGFNWDFYAPILRFAKANQLPLLAINTPTEVTRKVARTGLESLAPDDLKWIPPLSEIDTGNEVYRQRLLETYQSFHQAHGNHSGFDRFFQAQVLWDETMADTIAQYWLKHQDRKIVVLVGQGHLLYGDGIPSRVKRRLTSVAKWKQQSVLLDPSTEIQSERSRPVADSFWFTAKPIAPK